MPKPWTPERIAAESTRSLEQIKINCQKTLERDPSHNEALSTLQLCDAELSKRRPAKTADEGPYTGTNPYRLLADAVNTKMVECANAIELKYDLGGKSLLSPKGKAKVGGLIPKGQCRIDHYIRYEMVGKEFIELNAHLPKGDQVGELYYIVFAPQKLLRAGSKASELRPKTPNMHDVRTHQWGVKFSEFGEASAAFEKLIAEVTRSKSAQT